MTPRGQSCRRTRRAVLHDDAAGGVRAEQFAGPQIRLRIGLGPIDLRRAHREIDREVDIGQQQIE